MVSQSQSPNTPRDWHLYTYIEHWGGFRIFQGSLDIRYSKSSSLSHFSCLGSISIFHAVARCFSGVGLQSNHELHSFTLVINGEGDTPCNTCCFNTGTCSSEMAPPCHMLAVLLLQRVILQAKLQSYFARNDPDPKSHEIPTKRLRACEFDLVQGACFQS